MSYNRSPPSERGGGPGGRGGERGGGSRGAPRNDRNPAAAPQIDNRRERTRIRDRIKEVFEAEGIEEGNTLLEAKMPPGSIGKSVADFQTNAFRIKCAQLPIYKYHFDVDAFRDDNPRAKAVQLTKRSNDECIASDRKTRCRDVFILMKNLCTDVFIPGDHKYYYDLQSTLVSTTKLPTMSRPLELRSPAFQAYPSLQSFKRILVSIKACEVETDSNTGDMSMATFTDLEKYDRSHQAFLELATSQWPLFAPNDVICLTGGKMYLMKPELCMPANLVQRCNTFSRDKFIGIGVKKSAKYVEGPLGRNHQNVALLVNPLKTVFFRQQTVSDFLKSKNIDVNDPQQIIRNSWQLKGLHVFNPHLAGKRTFCITALARENARQKRFTQRDGSVINVEDYFYDKYRVEYVNPIAPLVVGKGKTDCLPIDHAVIDDNQPVPKNKMDQHEDSEMIKIAAVTPANFVNEVKEYIKALGLDQMSVERDGVQVTSKQLNVKGRMLEPPSITYANDQTAKPDIDGLWNLPTKKFLRGSTCTKWGLLRNGRDQVNTREYKTAFVGMCRRHGVEIALEPAMEGQVRDDLEDWFIKAKNEGIEFLAFITDKQIKNQGELKMLERKYEITTQNVTSKVANDAAGRGKATLENIIQKTNPKLGGLNYTIDHRNQKFIDDAFGENCLIIGIALSHSGSIDDVQRARGGTSASTQLSSVGYAANTGKDRYEFIGDMIPNNPHRIEILEIIPGIVATTISKYHENKGYFPTSMILYLNGSSEGEFAMLKRFEIPLVYRKMVDSIGKKIPLTVIVPQRSHMARICKPNPNPDDKPPRQNIQPGVVIDTGLVHPTQNEFYLNSHTTIQGTARTPKYTILHNDNEKADMDAIEHITYYLCYGHQIVNSPTSLPSCVYVAMDYAERGTKVFKAIATSDVEEIMKNWSYDASETFRNRRINA